jgi:hypothetical protein
MEPEDSAWLAKKFGSLDRSERWCRLGDNVRRLHHRSRRLATVVPVAVTPCGDPPTGFGEAPKGEVDRRMSSATGDTSRRVAKRLRQRPKGFDEAPKR